jgi:hypothetical protein
VAGFYKNLAEDPIAPADLFLTTNHMRHFCRKSGYFSGNSKRREINLLSESRSIILGNSFRMWLHEKQADPELHGRGRPICAVTHL